MIEALHMILRQFSPQKKESYTVTCKPDNPQGTITTSVLFTDGSRAGCDLLQRRPLVGVGCGITGGECKIKGATETDQRIIDKIRIIMSARTYHRHAG